MCKVRNGHDYTKDAETEAGMGEEAWGRRERERAAELFLGPPPKRGPWDSMVANLRSYAWLLVPLALWVYRVETRIGPNGFDRADGEKMETRISTTLIKKEDERYKTLIKSLDHVARELENLTQAHLRHMENHGEVR